MKLDFATLQLFPYYPRDFAIPERWTVYSVHHMERMIDEHNGIDDCYTSVYSTSPKMDENCLIDKIPFELDGLAQSINDAKKLVSFANKEDIPVVLVASGARGIHVYFMLKPIKYNHAKSVLVSATYGVLREVFGDLEWKPDTPGSSVDPHLLGNVSALIRIPNTLRPPGNRSYCTYLPLSRLDSLDEVGLILHTKGIHNSYTRDVTRSKTLFDMPMDSTEINSNGNIRITDYAKIYHEPVSSSNFWVGKDPSKILPRILRPCLARRILGNNPIHDVRVATTIELLEHFNQEELVTLYSKLGWVDFDAGVTDYQIGKCKGLKSYSCRTIRSRVPGIRCCEEEFI